MSKVEFNEVAVIPDLESGIIASITAREKHDRTEYSFSLQKEFEREGRTERTSWLSKRHVEGAQRLLDKVLEWIDAAEDKDRAARREAKRRAPDDAKAS